MKFPKDPTSNEAVRALVALRSAVAKDKDRLKLTTLHQHACVIRRLAEAAMKACEREDVAKAEDAVHRLSLAARGPLPTG